MILYDELSYYYPSHYYDFSGRNFDFVSHNYDFSHINDSVFTYLDFSNHIYNVILVINAPFCFFTLSRGANRFPQKHKNSDNRVINDSFIFSTDTKV